MKPIKLILYSILHFIVDYICIFKVVGILGNEFSDYNLIIFLLYNGIAFVLQPLYGILVDKYNIEKYSIIIFVVCLVLGSIINHFIPSCILLGLGNQIFHVIGGKYSSLNKNKSYPLGVFVSTGVFGLTIATVTYNIKCLLYIALILLVLLSIILLFIKDNNINKEEVKVKKVNKIDIILIISIVLVVFVRSFVGKILHYEFESNTLIVILFGLFGFVGKFIGGFLRDLFGSFKVILISLVLFMIFSIVFKSNVVLILISVILINISMPITLYELNRINKNHEGLNFGLLAAVLFPGVFLGILYQYNIITYIVFVGIGCILSILNIFIVEKHNDNFNY